MEDKENDKPAQDPGPIAQWERELEAVKKALEERLKNQEEKK